jgi:hypothetical protein
MPFLPKHAAAACIRRSRRLLGLAMHSKLPDSRARNDLRRTALVLAVASLDAYMHWLVFRRLSDVRKTENLPNALAKFLLPFANLAELADEVIVARRRSPKSNCRPWVMVKAAMQERLLKETFQSYDNVSTALALAGFKKGWSRVSELLGVPCDEIKLGLGEIVHRRNQIVHEGDIVRLVRPRDLSYNDISHDEIAARVDWIEELIASIQAMVDEEQP